MAGLRSLGFVFGGLGLAFFLGGVLYGLVSPADSGCSNVVCEKSGFGQVHTRILFIWGAGLVSLALGILLLAIGLRRAATTNPSEPKPPTRPGPVRAQPSRPAGPPSGTSPGPAVRVRQPGEPPRRFT